MDNLAQLELVGWKLRHGGPDVRQAVLEVSGAFLDATSDPALFRPGLRDEVQAIRRELQEIQPRFASHVRTSVLFDREGAGRPGYDRAERLAGRILAVVRAVQPPPSA